MDRRHEEIQWLLQDNHPAIRYRCITELLGEEADRQAVIAFVHGLLPKDWREAEGLWFTYYLTAIAECGLTRADIEIPREKVLSPMEEGSFDFNCEDFMMLRALVLLGYHDEPRVLERLSALPTKQLPDGGFLCLHRLRKLKYMPKSCVKSNNLALLLAAVCKKRGIELAITSELLRYFWEHHLFYTKADPSELILRARSGWRTIDTFYPFEVMRVGLQNVLEAFGALGYGNDARLQDAWRLLEGKKNDAGQYVLEGTLSKSYLPKERVGQPSKWVTLYALLAQKSAAPYQKKT